MASFTKNAPGQESELAVRSQKKKPFGPYIRRYWQLYALLALPLLYLIVFKYAPMIYIQIAFKKYKLNMSVWEMPLAKNNGFEYFIKAFGSKDFRLALKNTIKLNLLDLIIGFPAPIIFALILNELPFPKFKKTTSCPGSSSPAWRCSCLPPATAL